MQLQVFFTIGLSMWATGERMRPFQVAALALACAGVGVILWHTDRSTTPLGLALVVLAALSWAGGNHVARLGGRVNMLAYVVWASLFSVPPLLLLALLLAEPLPRWKLLAAALVLGGLAVNLLWPRLSRRRTVAPAPPGA